MSRLGGTLLIAALLSACGSGAAGTPRPLGVTAHGALGEARAIAGDWSPDARLRWVEGEGIDDRGYALPDRGGWAFHFTTPASALELVVRVSPFELIQEERRPTSPPGYTLEDRYLGPTWLDSGEVLAAISGDDSAPPRSPFSLLLVPTRPPRWLVRSEVGRRWSVHAESGEVLSR